MSRMLSSEKGFTLIELLVVIAIIAILSVVVILTLNPAELLKQTRDSNRISDLSTLKSGISIYLVDALSPNLAQQTPSYGGCYLSSIGANATTSLNCGVFKTAGATTNTTSTQSFYRNVNAQGWLPVAFTQITAGSPFGNLPVDPVNNSAYYYAYAATSTGGLSFEVDAFMESQKYNASGTADVESKDGGDNNSVYEVGTNLTQ